MGARTFAIVLLAGFVVSAATAMHARADDASAADMLNRARMLAAQQRYADAEQTYLAITVRYSGSPLASDAWQELATVYEQQGRPAEAADAYDRQYRAAPDGAPAQQALMNRGRVLLLANRQSDAADSFRLLLQKFPDSQFAGQASIQLATVLMSAGKFTEAAAAVKKTASSKNPDDALQAQIKLTEAYMRAGRWYEAEAAIKAVLKSQPENEYYKRQLAICYTNQKEYDKALELYEALAKYHPGDPAFENDLFSAMSNAGKLDAEIERLSAEFEKTPADTPAARRLISIYRWRKQSIEALTVLEKLVEKNPGKTGDAVELARLYFENQWKTKAIGLLDDVLKREPGNMGAWQMLGDVRKAAGDDAGARAAWEKSVAFNAADLGSFQRLGSLYTGKGMIAEAAGVYEQSRKAFNNDSLFTMELLYLYKAQMRFLDALDEYLRGVTTGLASPFTRDDVLQSISTPDISEKALRKIESWISRFPATRPLLVFYALAASDAGESEAAAGVLTAYAKANPDQPDIFIEAANALLDTGRDAAAADMYGEAAARDVDKALRSAALMGAARAYIWNRASGKASIILKELVAGAASPADLPDALFMLATMEQDAGECADAVGHYARLAAEYPGGVYTDRSALGRAKCLITLGNFAEAANVLDEVWKSPSAPARYDEIIFLQAEAKFLAGDLGKAQPLYKKIAESWPESRFINNALERLLFITAVSGTDEILIRTFMQAVSLRASGDTDGAAALFDGMTVTMSGTPLEPYARYELARTLSMQGRHEEAVALFMKISEVQDDTGLPSLSLVAAADELLKLGRPQDALRAYQRLLDTDPGSFQAQFAREQVQKLSASALPGS